MVRGAGPWDRDSFSHRGEDDMGSAGRADGDAKRKRPEPSPVGCLLLFVFGYAVWLTWPYFDGLRRDLVRAEELRQTQHEVEINKIRGQ